MSFDMENLNREDLAKAMSTDTGSWKVGAAMFCNKFNILRYKPIQKCFGLDLSKIAGQAEKLSQPQLEAKPIRGGRILQAKPFMPGKEDFERRLEEILKKPGGLSPESLARQGAKAHGAMVRNAVPQRFGAPLPDLNQSFGVVPSRNNTLFLRTIAMQRRLEQLPGYNKAQQTMRIQGKDYRIASHDVDDVANSPLPLISCGSSDGREMILFDPSCSPHLQQCYRNFESMFASAVQQKGGPLLPEEMAGLINSYMREHVFPGNDPEERVDNLVSAFGNQSDVLKFGQSPCMPIDVFLKNKAGVCRHHALVAAYLMDRLMLDHPEMCAFKGKVQMMRDVVPGGAHIWITLVTKDKLICIDTLNGIKGNLGDPTFQRSLAGVFGAGAVLHQKQKARLLVDKHRSFFVA